MNGSVAVGSGFIDREAVLGRKKLIQRKDASETYKKQSDFFLSKSPSLSELENLLTGKMELEGDTEEIAETVRAFQELEQQPKHTLTFGNTPTHAILGSTPEETITKLEHVRRAVLASTNPTPQDLGVAATVTNKIRSAEAQIVLNEQAKSQIELETQRQTTIESEVFNRSTQADFQEEKNTVTDLEKLKHLRLFEHAIAKYTFQVQLKRYGFSEQQPSFYRIA